MKSGRYSIHSWTLRSLWSFSSEAVDSLLQRRRTVLPFLRCLSYHTAAVFIRLRVFLPISILSFMASLKKEKKKKTGDRIRTVNTAVEGGAGDGLIDSWPPCFLLKKRLKRPTKIKCSGIITSPSCLYDRKQTQVVLLYYSNQNTWKSKVTKNASMNCNKANIRGNVLKSQENITMKKIYNNIYNIILFIRSK